MKGAFPKRPDLDGVPGPWPPWRLIPAAIFFVVLGHLCQSLWVSPPEPVPCVPSILLLSQPPPCLPASFLGGPQDNGGFRPWHLGQKDRKPHSGAAAPGSQPQASFCLCRRRIYGVRGHAWGGGCDRCCRMLVSGFPDN